MIELARVEAGQRGSRCVVTVHGEVDISNVREVAAAIESAVDDRTIEIVIDLSPTTYLDSAGLGLLLRLAERLSARRQRLSLVVPADSPVRAVLDVTGVPKVVPVVATLDE